MHKFTVALVLSVTFLAFSMGLGSVVTAHQPLDNFEGHTPIHVRDKDSHGKLLDNSIPNGLSPATVKSVYNLPATGGSGTIAIIDAYDDPTIQNDLNAFSAQYGLPNAVFEKHLMAPHIKNDSG